MTSVGGAKTTRGVLSEGAIPPSAEEGRSEICSSVLGIFVVGFSAWLEALWGEWDSETGVGSTA
jgi:hypothetical protein